VYESPSVTRSFGYSVDELVGRHAFELLHPDDLPDVAALFDQLLRAPGASVTVRVRYRRKDGAWRWVEGAAANLLAEPGIRAIVINYRDVTERKQAEEKLQYLSLHDALTGLYNRAYFEEEMARLERGRQTSVSVIMADLDGLKEINDSRGHAAGDELLREAVAVLTAVFRAEDVIARIGGDEFAALLPGAEAAAAQQAVERIRNHLAQYNSSHPGPPLSLSLGAATAEGGQSLADALKRADEGMYREKARVTHRTTDPLARQGGSP
jgi:diguanylate cyclase (GGDEF)-like protein/PAS domain S-box-containing protein